MTWEHDSLMEKLADRAGMRISQGERMLHDGRILNVYPLTFGRARLLLSLNRKDYELGFGDDEWMYQTQEDAVKAMNEWDGKGEPTGWIRHREDFNTGATCYRDDGSPESEYVRMPDD